ncbi:MAG: CRISPR-associated helicase Cas3 [Phormidium sp. OSCR]|nr:MAG: CRISPR-associated helicase Cas3 [Phormidium sp. OSCR]
MVEYPITLKPIFSEPAAMPPAGVTLPRDWGWMWHQAQTYQALQNPDIDVVVNTAMTGDGKSFAAYSPVLLNNKVALGMYPTNELARDQERQVSEYIHNFPQVNVPRINRLSSAELELFSEQEDLSKSQAIARQGSNSEVLLSNPDMIHYLHRGAYLNRYDNPDKLWNRIDKNFDQFIFDEFHVFSAPQVASVLNTLLLIRHTNRRKKFLFLSATPDVQLIERLDRVGFCYQVINPVEERKYAYPESEEEKKRLLSQGWRQISREIQFNLVALDSTTQASEHWLRENCDRILKDFLDHPGSKGAIILNSIAAVKRLVPRFKALFSQHGLTVGENTGLSGKQTKQQSLESDLVIGTSTIDVGVDFKINLLWFESSDSGNFIQRLGRLGRHDGSEDGEGFHPFHCFIAYGLVPQFLAERLFEKDDAPLKVGEHYERTEFNEAIHNEYRKINDFQGYYQKWGAVQSVKLYYDLGHPQIRTIYTDSRDRFRRDCQTLFDTSFKRTQGLMQASKRDWEAMSGKSNNPIAEEAWSFRGSSPLQCGLYDETEVEGGDRFKTYDLPGILSNLEIEMWTEAGFRRRLEAIDQPIAKGRFRHCLGFMRLKGYREERLNWRFSYPGSLEAVANSWKVQVLAGVQIWQPENPWIGEINQKLKRQALVSYVVPLPVREVRQRLRLPMHFSIYPIADSYSIHTTTPPYSLAIGQSALLLDVLAGYLKRQGGEIWIAG